jgi:outer membrane protein OmpA-like peptidoglycan-associated protein
VGTTTLNSTFSTRRAAAVETWLVAHGVNGARLTHEGYGDNATEDGRAGNHRVELVKL